MHNLALTGRQYLTFPETVPEDSITPMNHLCHIPPPTSFNNTPPIQSKLLSI